MFLSVVSSNLTASRVLTRIFVYACLLASTHPALAVDSLQACEKLLEGQTIIWRINELNEARQALGAGDPRFEPALSSLLAKARAALSRGPFSVVNKTQTPPSGDPRDYMSLAPYWWPAGNESGEYVRKDGQVNPERDSDKYDKVSMRMLQLDVPVLALATYFTGDDVYAAHAALLLRTWFSNPETRMNPNLRFAQAIPGKNTGRPTGIIDTQGLTGVVDAVELMKLEGKIDPQVVAAMRNWFSEYVAWLTTDPMALEERQARNNHGTYYDVQLMAFSLFSRKCSLAASVLRDTKYRIGKQIAPDGLMPEEIQRTRSFHYQIFNTAAFLKVARMAEHLGENLYTFKSEQGSSILSSVRLLSTYAGRENEWPYKRMGEHADTELWYMLRTAGTAIHSPWLLNAINRASARNNADYFILLTPSIEMEKKT